MKRILLALAIVTMVLPVAQQARGETEVSIDFFYNNLTDGDWIEVADYGYCWQPSVVVSNSNWRPYTDGHWAYTDVGWTWVSDEDFGWATYHYGRWARLEDRGWVWVPGYEWGPAWVSWRTGGDSIGWAPLPPTRERVYEGRAITGHVDVEFDIGPAYYNFVDVRYIGEPVLRDRIYPVSQNVTVISQTVNVTNITYTNSTVYNYGPDYNQLSQYSTRPIQRLTLQRETNVNFATGVRANEVTKVQGDRLVVAAPVKIQRAAQTVAPKNVKAKITQAKIEHGWAGTDAKAKEQIVQRMKTEDSKNVPPPKIAPTQKAGATAGASPATGASPAPVTSPAATASPATRTTPVTSVTPATTETPSKRGAVTPAPAMSVAPSATPDMSPEKGRQKGKRGEAPNVTPSATASAAGEEEQPRSSERARGRHAKPGEETAPTPRGATEEEIGAGAARPSREERGKGRKGRQGEEPGATPKPETPNASEHNNAAGMAPDEQPSGKQKSGRSRSEITTTPEESGATSNDRGQGRRQRQNELAPTGQSNAAEMRERSRRPEETHAQDQPAGGEGRKKGGERKKKGGEASPTPEER